MVASLQCRNDMSSVWHRCWYRARAVPGKWLYRFTVPSRRGQWL